MKRRQSILTVLAFTADRDLTGKIQIDALNTTRHVDDVPRRPPLIDTARVIHLPAS